MKFMEALTQAANLYKNNNKQIKINHAEWATEFCIEINPSYEFMFSDEAMCIPVLEVIESNKWYVITKEGIFSSNSYEVKEETEIKLHEGKKPENTGNSVSENDGINYRIAGIGYSGIEGTLQELIDYFSQKQYKKMTLEGDGIKDFLIKTKNIVTMVTTAIKMFKGEW